MAVDFIAPDFDGGRSVVLSYGFDWLSFQTRQEARKGAEEILALANADFGIWGEGEFVFCGL